jgi:hypothetical protein
MAKYRHRIFEMYEFRDEASRALTPKTEKTATEATTPESWTFRHLAVSRCGGVTHVQFKEAKNHGDKTLSSFGADLGHLADMLGRDSKVLLDFTGVASISSASINAIILFNKVLRTKGSRIALCSLEPTARKSFFPAR